MSFINQTCFVGYNSIGMRFGKKDRKHTVALLELLINSFRKILRKNVSFLEPLKCYPNLVAVKDGSTLSWYSGYKENSACPELWRLIRDI